MDRAPIDVESLRTALGSRWPRVDVVAETASTNADLLARAGAPDRSVFVAEHQSAGRGRFDRTWTSPPGAGLTLSVLLRPGVPLARWGWLPLLAGVAVCEAVAATTDLEASLKWPNDVLVGGAKLAGVLVQTDGDAVVVGIGINVSTTAAELPNETSTSLMLAGAGSVPRSQVLAVLLGRLDARVAQWSDCNGDAAACGLEAAYRALCRTIGSRARVTLSANETVEGEVVDIDDVGRLVVRTSDGDRTVGAGDVEHQRPA